MVSFAPESEPEELPVPLDDLNMKIRILHINSNKPISCLYLKQDGLQHQHLEPALSLHEIQTK